MSKYDFDPNDLALKVQAANSLRDILRAYNYPQVQYTFNALKLALIKYNLSIEHFNRITNARRSWTEIQLNNAVQNSFSIAGVVRTLGLTITTTNYATIRKHIELHKLDTTHFKTDNKATPTFLASNLETILVENSTAASAHLRKRLLKANLLRNQCYKCGQLPIWHGEPLTLQLDHINGVHTDCRIENLRILCPHCHTQTQTYSGRNRKTKLQSLILKPNIQSVESEPTRISTRKRKLIITKEELIQLANELPMTKIGERYGVSDNAIRRQCKQWNIPLKGQGHWTPKGVQIAKASH